MSFYTAEQSEWIAHVHQKVQDMSGKYHSEIEQCETNSEFAWEVHKAIAREGWCGLVTPSEYGGQGKGAREFGVVIEELARAGVPFFSIHTNNPLSRVLLQHGTEELKTKYLPKLASGEWVCGAAISEPNAGSSLKRMSTTATRQGNNYVINGFKDHINVAPEADVLHVFTRTEKGLTGILVDKDVPGKEYFKLDPIGLRDAPVYQIKFKDCTVPVSQQLGVEGEGYKLFFSSFDLSRIGNASMFIGWADAALDYTLNYITKRQVGDNKITDFQGIQWLLADMYTELEAAKLLRDKASWTSDMGLPHAKETAMAKLKAGEVAEKVVSTCMRICGGYALYADKPFVQLYSSIKTIQVGGGALEVMRNLIASQILKEL
ncbi:MAG: acyl-CoA dehydrogenase family protein [Bacillota bacterium]